MCCVVGVAGAEGEWVSGAGAASSAPSSIDSTLADMPLVVGSTLSYIDEDPVATILFISTS